MSYIGREPITGNFVKLDAISVVNGQASYTMQNGGENFTAYETVNQFLVSLNGILQSPVDSFTVSSSTITFASNLVTGDVIDFIMVLGNTLDIGTPSDNTVSLAKLTATGTKDATTFLRGDNTFSVPAGGTNTPAFCVQMGGGSQSFSLNTTTKVEFDTEKFDTANAFNTTNYNFTVPTGQGGKYFIHGKVFYNDISSTDANQELNIYVNDTRTSAGTRRTVGTTGRDGTVTVSEILVLSAGDVVDMRIYTNAGSGTLNGANVINVFEGFKIIE